MNRRKLLRVVGGGCIAAATSPMTGCSSALPAEAVRDWKGPGNEADPRRWMLAHAILAPHSHNLQSWLVDLRTPNVIVLRMDLQRLLPETDPRSRQLVMSQGTFLELLDLAARQRGYRAEIQAFPDGPFGPNQPDTRPTARIRLVADATVQRDPLFEQIFKRHTNRAAYEPRMPDASAIEAIRRSVAGYPVAIGFTEPGRTPQIEAQRDIAKEAWRIELTTPRTLMESYRVLRVGPTEIAQHRDGLSINEPMVRALTLLGLFDRSKPSAADSTALSGQIKDFNVKIDTTPAFFWMTSLDNERATQLLAGRAYARAQLAATAAGLSMQPLQQALQEYPEQAKPFAEIRKNLGLTRPTETVQMWARLGYGQAAGPSPRRGVDAIVEHAAA